jgi:hypothetical protein
MSEKDLLNEVQLAASRSRRCVLFRNNTGVGWVGAVVRRTPTEITLADFRPLHAGLCRGSSDLIGWTEVTITPEMVGRKMAVFTAFEGKTGRQTLKTHQANFLQRLREAGGIGAEVRNARDIETVIEDFEKTTND